jgi:hypothetical protein
MKSYSLAWSQIAWQFIAAEVLHDTDDYEGLATSRQCCLSTVCARTKKSKGMSKRMM